MVGLVENWFGESFQYLDPLIQRLHRYDSTLYGSVDVEYVSGVAGKIGKRLGRKFGLPLACGSTALTVEISHTSTHLIWTRKFGEYGKRMVSEFCPVGEYPHGGWRETTGGVDIILGGRY